MALTRNDERIVATGVAAGAGMVLCGLLGLVLSLWFFALMALLGLAVFVCWGTLRDPWRLKGEPSSLAVGNGLRALGPNELDGEDAEWLAHVNRLAGFEPAPVEVETKYVKRAQLANGGYIGTRPDGRRDYVTVMGEVRSLHAQKNASRAHAEQCDRIGHIEQYETCRCIRCGDFVS